ncbi:uncharacterized protein LOC142578803 isoform X4 [Dermacentor variabilis]|uniref:uncharacterized protein LOC142578803 isoform X4 n=1 Tax=Dermacentor variabilis TaxID=34621 RepID=UPI003F5B2EAA
MPAICLTAQLRAPRSPFPGRSPGRTRRVPRAPRNVSCSGGGTPPLRRLRRSLRLSGQRQGTTRSEGTLCLVHDAAACPSQGSRGSSAAAVPERRVALTELPLEVLFHVFLHCDVDSLSVLSICSLLLRDQLVGYLSWAPALKALSFRHMHQKDAVKQCRNLGVLMKRVTCLFPTKERLKIMLRFIEKFVSRPTLVRSHLPRDLEAAGRQWHQYGAFLMAAVVGWVDSECQLVHDVLLGLSSAQRFTSRVLGARPAIVFPGHAVKLGLPVTNDRRKREGRANERVAVVRRAAAPRRAGAAPLPALPVPIRSEPRGQLRLAAEAAAALATRVPCQAALHHLRALLPPRAPVGAAVAATDRDGVSAAARLAGAHGSGAVLPARGGRGMVLGRHHHRDRGAVRDVAGVASGEPRHAAGALRS